MTNFMAHDFTVTKIELACLVEAGKSTLVHRNRKAHGLAIFPDGERSFHFDKKKIDVGKNTIVFFPKGSNYVIKDKIPSVCYAINFQMPEGVVFEPFAFKLKNVNSFLESFKSSQKIWRSKKTGYASKVKSELYSIIYQMQSEYSIPYCKSSVIQPAIDYIHSNYDKENIRVTYLAEICNISTVYLSSTFVKVLAMPPVKYINHLKMTRAKELLASGMYGVREACYLSGYNDESYFSREFKKQWNETPLQYKESFRK